MDLETAISQRIDEIRKSNLLPKVISDLNNRFFKEIPEVDFRYRVKDITSAIGKCIRKSYDSPDKLTDLAGIMGVTKSLDDVYKIASYLEDRYNVTNIDDYIKCPKLGYQSYHVNIVVQNLPIEVQLKTQNMKFAQDFIHDRIYKNDLIPSKLKPSIMRNIFPVLYASPHDVIERNIKTLDNVVANFKDVQSISTEISLKFIDKNISIFKNIILDDLKDMLSKSLSKAGYVNTYIGRIDNAEKNLAAADHWLKDLDVNTSKLNSLNTSINKVKRIYSRSMQNEYNKTIKDMEIDKKFLKECKVTDQADLNKQLSGLDLCGKDCLKQEFSAITSGIETIIKAINDITDTNDLSRDIQRSKDIER